MKSQYNYKNKQEYSDLLSLIPFQDKGRAENLLYFLVGSKDIMSDETNTSCPMDRSIKNEIKEIVDSIENVKQQIIELEIPDASWEKLDEANSELEEVVGTTEVATNQILESSEKISEIAETLKNSDVGGTIENEISEIEAHAMEIILSSSFQDIVAQRLKKVTASLYFIDRKLSLILSSIGIDNNRDVKDHEVSNNLDDTLMKGPSSDGMDQGDIDSFF